MAETADLKSLAQRVIARDTSRDSRRDRLSHRHGTEGVPAGQWNSLELMQPEPEADLNPKVPQLYGPTLIALREVCPAYVEAADWRRAIKDADRFLRSWGEQASAFGWTAPELFGLAPIPERPAPNWRRLSRYDLAGLIWLLRGRPVIALSNETAAIQCSGRGFTTYRRPRSCELFRSNANLVTTGQTG
jgi:hypothetical protein